MSEEKLGCVCLDNLPSAQQGSSNLSNEQHRIHDIQGNIQGQGESKNADWLKRDIVDGDGQLRKSRQEHKSSQIWDAFLQVSSIAESQTQRLADKEQGPERDDHESVKVDQAVHCDLEVTGIH